MALIESELALRNELAPADLGNALSLAPSAGAFRPVMSAALMPQTLDDAVRLAGLFFKAGMFGVKTPEQALTVLLTGMELGLSSAQSMRTIHVINNKPVLSADVMVALCKRQDHLCRFFQMVSSDNLQATFKTHRTGDPEPVTMTFTMEDAKRANLLGNPTWTKFPSNMLRARCASNLARAVYPDIILGLYTEEEATAIYPTPDAQQVAHEAQFQETLPVNDFPNQRKQAAEVYESYEATADERQGISRDGTPRAERTPPEERTPHGERQPAPDADGKPFCRECLRPLTAAQASLSARNYGDTFCPACQRTQSRRAASE